MASQAHQFVANPAICASSHVDATVSDRGVKLAHTVVPAISAGTRDGHVSHCTESEHGGVNHSLDTISSRLVGKCGSPDDSNESGASGGRRPFDIQCFRKIRAIGRQATGKITRIWGSMAFYPRLDGSRHAYRRGPDVADPHRSAITSVAPHTQQESRVHAIVDSRLL